MQDGTTENLRCPTLRFVMLYSRERDLNLDRRPDAMIWNSALVSDTIIGPREQLATDRFRFTPVCRAMAT